MLALRELGVMKIVAVLALLGPGLARYIPLEHHGMSVTIDSGFVVDDAGQNVRWIGTYTSGLQRYIDDTFPPITDSDSAQVTFFNTTELRVLTIKGDSTSASEHDYLVDVTLNLPSLFVLKLEGSMGVAPNATINTDVTPPMVALDNVYMSVVLGGNYDSTANATYEAIRIANGSHCQIRGVTAKSSGTNVIEVHNGNRHEISHSNLDGGDAAFRCIWLLATNRGMVSFNYATRCVGHVIDFDAYTSNSAAWSNVAEHNGVTGKGEGIFVEETAKDNFIFNNTVSKNGGNGIAVYSNVVGPVSGNIIASNTVENNNGVGLSSGGYGHDPTKHAGDNIFVGNKGSGNKEGEVDFQIMHGATINDFWTGNSGKYMYEEDPHSSANVSVLELPS